MFFRTIQQQAPSHVQVDFQQRDQPPEIQQVEVNYLVDQLLDVSKILARRIPCNRFFGQMYGWYLHKSERKPR